MLMNESEKVKDNYFNESGKTNHELSDELNSFAYNQIKVVAEQLSDYLKCENYEMGQTMTFIMKLDKELKILSVPTIFYKAGISFRVDLSNPYEFVGTRIWTTDEQNKKIWSNFEKMSRCPHFQLMISYLSKDWRWFARFMDFYMRIDYSELLKYHNKNIKLEDEFGLNKPDYALSSNVNLEKIIENKEASALMSKYF
jgi:hypothetical protein